MRTQTDVSVPDSLQSAQGVGQISRNTVQLDGRAPWSRSAFLSRRQVAALLGVTIHCVEKWAERNTGPRFYRTGRQRQSRTVYRIEDVEDFLNQRLDAKPLAPCRQVQLLATNGVDT